MKCDETSSVLQMNDQTFAELLTEVKETIADVDFDEPARQSFGIVDMWNIRRNARPANGLIK